jgi:hypothetical protein
VFKVELDTSAIERRLAAMQERLAGLPNEMADTLTTWQREDMKRGYPNTQLNGDMAETDIWPRSRLASQHKPAPKAGVRTLRRRTREQRFARMQQPAPAVAHTRPQSTRPILRDVLYDKLGERMQALLETVTWG